jgi:hypothetical protein
LKRWLEFVGIEFRSPHSKEKWVNAERLVKVSFMV